MGKKIRAVAVVAAALALMMSGCVKSSGGDPAVTGGEAGEQVTINMMHLWPEAGASGQHQIVNKIIAEYQAENPGVTIKQEVLDNERYKAKIRVLSAVNELPDVGLTWAAGYLQDFVRGELFTPLDDLLHGELQDSFIPGTTEAYMVGGKTYALPLEFNIAPVYYNKRIFEKYGLQPPATYDEFLGIVKTLADHGVVPIALGNKDRWTGSLWYMYLADRIAGTEKLASAIKGAASFTEPGLVEAARRVQDLVAMNAFNKGFNGLSNDEVKAEYMNSEAAMYLMGTWELPNYTTSANIPQDFRDSMGFFKFPAIAGGKGNIDGWVGGPGVGLFVAENSPVREEAKKFVKYFVKRWGEESVNGAGVIPATKVDTSKIELPQLYVDLLKEVNKATSITLFADVQMAGAAAEVHLNQIQALFGDEITPDDFAKAHDAAFKTGK
ncbi:raffinose/stachyose/melibiose transport system substrate-binding protein [Paenibacillus sp. RU4T]|uniref:extracellular solute-binding protein n=1 Tax=Paenibacillus sp. RU4T TaxID=1907394 RepID=UPI0009570583|nr:raffinose/stachyose/melibiose transport system substrate-binding protein [Paenibacillus sp. RU4X]SIR72092.1 raffinose/stachyose/melibiose transport system substrate-binding protein [Paenibacillus sp. RU4T]